MRNALTCLKCSHVWVPRYDHHPKVCAKCGTRYWNMPPRTNWFYQRYRVTESGCWEWLGCKDVGGYGRVTLKKTNRLAHRCMYEHMNGEIPDGAHICHKCDNRSCINPEHLYLGTHQDNMKDRDAKGRGVVPRGEHHHKAKLTWARVREIRSTEEPANALAKKFGVCKSTIERVRRGRFWKSNVIEST